MKKLLLAISLVCCSLGMSAQKINPDSAFVDTVKEWHIKGSDWYEERMKVASIKAIKDLCNTNAQQAYNEITQQKKLAEKVLRLMQEHPDMVYDESVSKYYDEFKNDFAEFHSDFNEYNPNLKRKLAYVRNYKGKVKTKTFIESALSVVIDSDILYTDISMCNTDLKMIINAMELNGYY